MQTTQTCGAETEWNLSEDQCMDLLRQMVPSESAFQENASSGEYQLIENTIRYIEQLSGMLQTQQWNKTKNTNKWAQLTTRMKLPLCIIFFFSFTYLFPINGTTANINFFELLHFLHRNFRKKSDFFWRNIITLSKKAKCWTKMETLLAYFGGRAFLSRLRENIIWHLGFIWADIKAEGSRNWTRFNFGKFWTSCNFYIPK